MKAEKSVVKAVWSKGTDIDVLYMFLHTSLLGMLKNWLEVWATTSNSHGDEYISLWG